MDTLGFIYQGTPVRVVQKDNKVWFCAKDVYCALHLTNARVVRQIVADDEIISVNLIYAASGHRVNFISESGLYKLIMRSDKPEAKKFQDWVTRDVLPSIRKTGTYSLQGTGLPAMTPEQAAALAATADVLVQRARRLLAARRWQLHLLMTQWGYDADEFKRLASEAADMPPTASVYDLSQWEVGTPTAADIRRAVDVVPVETTSAPQWRNGGYLPPVKKM